jgi:hypothetical protein
MVPVGLVGQSNGHHQAIPVRYSIVQLSLLSTHFAHSPSVLRPI